MHHHGCRRNHISLSASLGPGIETEEEGSCAPSPTALPTISALTVSRSLSLPPFGGVSIINELLSIVTAAEREGIHIRWGRRGKCEECEGGGGHDSVFDTKI